MALYFKNKEISAVNLGTKVINSIYKGGILIWSAAMRLWKGKQMWKSNEIWKK